jgi:hypothetical protein
VQLELNKAVAGPRVVVYNRGDCCGERLEDAKVYLSYVAKELADTCLIDPMDGSWWSR